MSIQPLRTTKGGVVLPQVERVLAKLGADISHARRTRHIAASDFAERIGIGRATLHRLERGDPGISLNTLALALNALGMLQALADLVDPSRDEIGLLQMRDAAPRRVARHRFPKREDASERDEADHTVGDRYEGY